MHPSNPLAPRASCILCFIQVSFDPRSIFIQDVTKFLLPLKKRPSTQKPGTSLMLKKTQGNDSLYVCFDPHASIGQYASFEHELSIWQYVFFDTSFDWALACFDHKLRLRERLPSNKCVSISFLHSTQDQVSFSMLSCFQIFT